MDDSQDALPSFKWMTDEIRPKFDSVATTTARYPYTVSFENDYFREGDLLMLPETGEKAYAAKRNEDGSFDLDTRYVRHVTMRVIGTEMQWYEYEDEGGEWVEVDVWGPEPIPHWEVRNLRPVEGARLLCLGPVYKQQGEKMTDQQEQLRAQALAGCENGNHSWYPEVQMKQPDLRIICVVCGAKTTVPRKIEHA